MTARSTTTIDLAGALPQRAIAVRPPQTIAPLGMLGLFALLFGMMGGVLWWLGPDLARDWRMRNDVIPANDARVEEARCRTKLFVLRVCDVTLADDRNGSSGKRTLWYVYILAPGAERLAPLRSRSDPALLSTALGLEKLYARSITLAMVVAGLAFCIGVSIRVIHQGIDSRRAFAGLSGRGLRPVIVEIERNNLVPPRRRLWVYRYDDGGRQGRAFVELPSKDRPLFTTAEERWALALSGEQGGTPLLLDAKLDCLDLTQAERAAFYDACRAAFGRQDGGNPH